MTFLKNLALMAVSVLVCFGVLEAGTRMLIDDGMNYHLEMWKYAKDIKRVSAIPGVGHEHTPGSSARLMGVDVQINSLGFRDDPMEVVKPQGVKRVMMLGDSLTFGWGVAFADTPSQILERRLQQDGLTVEVVNTGVGNTNTRQQVSFFSARGKDLKPDLVVLNYFINDAEPTPVPKGTWLDRHSFLLNVINGSLDSVARMVEDRPDWREYYAALYRTEAPGWQQAQGAVAELAEYCRANGIPLVMVNQPELHKLVDYPFAAEMDKVRAVAERNGITYLDLLPSVIDLEPESTWVSPSDAHPNRRATERFAAAIFDLIGTGNWQRFVPKAGAKP